MRCDRIFILAATVATNRRTITTTTRITPVTNPRPGEHDAALPPAIAPIGDHDADAVYFGEAVTFAHRDGNSVIVLSTKYIAVATILRVVAQSEGWLQRLGQPPSVFDAACPIYLRTLSLRI